MANGDQLIYRISVDDKTKTINPIEVKIGEATYSIDLTGLTLGLPPMPEPTAPTGSETGVTNDLTVADKKEQVAADIQNAIANVSTGKVDKDASAEDGTAPEVTSKELTINFSGKVDSAAVTDGTVKLDSTAVAALKNEQTGENQNGVKVNVKVETNTANVILPAGALAKLDSGKAVEATIAKKTATDYTGTGTKLSETEKALVSKMDVIADVTVKQDTSEPMTGLTGNSAITIQLKVSEAGSYHILYINTAAGKLEKMTATAVSAKSDENNGFYVECTTGHLSPYGVVKDSTENKALLDQLGVSESTGAPKAVFTSTLTPADQTQYYGGKLTLSNLDSNKKYLVRLDTGTKVSDKVPTACYVISGDTSKTISCLREANLIVFEFEKNAVLSVSNATATYFMISGGVGTPVQSLTGNS